ncbi:MAG TPA: non-homologous end-joining DNA ligase [Acidimicrobiales bacterium]|nr:non-homologous end-joining DNA ligase [Acidimicrobiales bacterium]
MYGAPPELAPMLATSVAPPPSFDGWLIEPKWDGVRAIVTVHEGRVTVASRRGNDVTGGYPELAALADALGGRSAVLDGEIVAFEERTGRPSFQRLQRRMHVRSPSAQLRRDVPVQLLVFDVLWLDGELVVERPQADRRKVLEGLALEGPCWHTSPLIPPASPDELLAACREIGMEGYVAKRADAPYLPGRRSSAWVKVKCIQRREFVVGGWSPGQGGRTGSIGSLAVGCWGLDPATGASTGRLHYVGLVGSGLSGDLIRQLTEVFSRTRRDDSPFTEKLIGALYFVEPLLVAEVAYNEITESGTLRQPSLQGFRTDLDPGEVVADEDLQLILSRRPSQIRIRQMW